MYGLAANGQIAAQYPPGQAAAVGRQLSRLRAAGLRVVPTLANITGGRWSYQPLAGILHDPARRARHIQAIAALVRQHRYAGIDIDYENLRAGDRSAFTALVTGLAAALHADGKVLSVAVFAKTTDAGYAPRNRAQDYAALGRAADQVRIMAYDYHWTTSAPGPVAPVRWVRAVIGYARRQLPASKIILGVGLYGYDWSGGHATAISWLRAFQLSSQFHVRPRYDPVSQAPWFGYTDRAGRRHLVWFENAASARAKFGAAAGARLGGVFLWMFGWEDGGTWPALHQVLPVPGPAPARPAPGSPGGAS
jgi:spore germination protein YaaH